MTTEQESKALGRTADFESESTGRRRYAITAALAVFLSTLTSASSLQSLEPVDHLKIVCGCTFHRLDPDGAINYGTRSISGDVLVILDVNADPPHALVNLGEGNAKFSPAEKIEFPLYQCEAGYNYRSIWLAEDATLSIDLSVTGDGLEACWFRGTAVASGPTTAASAIINGSCGC